MENHGWNSIYIGKGFDSTVMGLLTAGRGDPTRGTGSYEVRVVVVMTWGQRHECGMWVNI